MKKPWYTAAVILLFCWVAAAGLILAWRTSMTTDEGIHTASAYLALTRGEFRFDPEHPFLFKDLTAVPLLVLHPNLPPDDQALWAKAAPTFYDSWKEAREWTDQWFYKSGNNAQLMIFLARLPGVLSLLALCWLAFFVASQWFSPTVGLWTLFFTALNPTLLAHGSLTNTDAPLALAFLAALWALWRYGQQPTYRTALWTGLGMAATLLTKISGIAILPIALIWLIYVAVRSKLRAKTAILHALVVVAVIWIAIWSMYFWHSPLVLNANVLNASQMAQSYLSEHAGSLENIARVVRWILPLPYLKGVFLVLGGSTLGRETFLLNHVFSSGIWFYFPVVFALKTQLVALILLLVGLVMLRTKWSAKNWGPLMVLLLTTVVIFGGLALKSKLNLGIRHITPLLPLFSLFLAVTVVTAGKLLRQKYLVPVIILLYAVPVLWQFNNLIGFSNILVWPNDKAYLYYDDSNLDWGQQAQAIAELAHQDFATNSGYVNYIWNPYALDYFGFHAQSFDPDNPPRQGLIVLTASQLSRDPRYAYFRSVVPAARIANDTFFYRAETLPPR